MIAEPGHSSKIKFLFFLFGLSFMAMATSAGASPIDGIWLGTLGTGSGALRVQLVIKSDSAGRHLGTLDSPDQNGWGMECSEIEFHDNTFTLKVPSVGGRWAGILSKGGETLSGIWNQGTPMPLNFTRQAAALSPTPPKRPQEDAIAKASRDFRSREVTFGSARAGIRLAGSLTLPAGNGPFPAVVLVSGSGPNTRDEVVDHHKIFYVLADYLNRRGLVVLRYDKRGVGASKGTYGGATTEDFVDDAEGAVEFLKSDGEVDPKSIGILGHSEGGLIAPEVAVKDSSVAFVVLLAGPGISGAKLMPEQEALILAADGMPPDQADRVKEYNGKLFAAVAAAGTRGEAEQIVRSMVAQAKEQKIPGTEDPDAAVKWITDPWFLYFLKYDPAPTLRLVKVPVLALAGSLDLQVPPAVNLPVIRDALKGNPGATVRELDGMNHLFQKARTGSPLEYGQIEETMDPEALRIIGNWIMAHCRR